jgi:hypothetical protein
VSPDDRVAVVLVVSLALILAALAGEYLAEPHPAPQVLYHAVLYGARASCQLDDRAEAWQSGGLLLTRPREVAPNADRVLAEMVDWATYWLEMRDWARHVRGSLDGDA